MRIPYPGVVYHVTCWDNNRRDIFWDDTDPEVFLKIR